MSKWNQWNLRTVGQCERISQKMFEFKFIVFESQMHVDAMRSLPWIVIFITASLSSEEDGWARLLGSGAFGGT